MFCRRNHSHSHSNNKHNSNNSNNIARVETDCTTRRAKPGGRVRGRAQRRGSAQCGCESRLASGANYFSALFTLPLLIISFLFSFGIRGQLSGFAQGPPIETRTSQRSGFKHVWSLPYFVFPADSLRLFIRRARGRPSYLLLAMLSTRCLTHTACFTGALLGLQFDCKGHRASFSFP